MHLSFSEMDDTLSTDEIVIREADLADLHLSVETYDTDFDTSPLFVGLKNDRCHCPHWGYLLSGRAYVEYEAHEETISAGDVFYLEPGHTVQIEGGTEYISFSPAEEFREMMEVVVGNFEQQA